MIASKLPKKNAVNIRKKKKDQLYKMLIFDCSYICLMSTSNSVSDRASKITTLKIERAYDDYLFLEICP